MSATLLCMLNKEVSIPVMEPLEVLPNIEVSFKVKPYMTLEQLTRALGADAQEIYMLLLCTDGPGVPDAHNLSHVFENGLTAAAQRLIMFQDLCCFKINEVALIASFFKTEQANTLRIWAINTMKGGSDEK